MPLSSKLKSWWCALNFNKQLTVAILSTILITLCSFSFFSFLTGEYVFLQRGYSLLEMNNNFIVKRFYEYFQDKKTIPDSNLSPLFTDRRGLGESGEVYLVDLKGNLVTESRFLKNPKPAPIPIGIKDTWMGIKKDYRNISVLAFWQRVYVNGFNGYIASEIDEEEIHRPLYQLKIFTFAISIFFSLITLIIVPNLSRALSQNVDRLNELKNTRYHALIEGQENERKRLSLELHDDIGQKLTALAWTMASKKEESHQLIEKINQISKDIKAISQSLSTHVLDYEGLIPATQQLFLEIQNIAKTKNLNIELFIDQKTDLKNLDPIAAKNIYRIIQEALTNMLKYSHATKGFCRLSRNDNQLEIVIKDNGIGLNDKMNTGLGLFNIQSRVESLGGIFRIESQKQKGVTLSALIPWKGLFA